MRKLLISAVLALATISGLSACSRDKTASSESGEHLATMTVDEVDKALAANEATVIDCNGDRTRKKLGVIPQAVLISNEETFTASELPADKTRKLIFYCSGPG